MSYICIHCGHHFDVIDRKHYDPATGVWEEYCPNCGSEDFCEAGYCKKCDDYFPVSKVTNHVCESCIDKSISIDTALKYGADRKEAVELNGFLAWAFSASEINEILTAVIRLENIHGFDDAKEFCKNDLYDYSEWLEEHEE